MGLAAGRLNRRIAIRRKTMLSDGHGGQNSSWDTVATVWAETKSQNGREAVIAGALQGISAWRIVIRYRAAVTTADQVRIDGRDYNIRTIEDPDGRREMLVIIADTSSVEA